MKRALTALATLSFCFMTATAFAADAATTAAPSTTTEGTQLKDKADKISYSIGMDVGRSIAKQKIDVKADTFVQGFKDGINGSKTPLMTDEEMRNTIMALQTEMIEKQKTQMKEVANKNLSDGQKFLDDNKKNKDIKTTASGLQYRVIQEGKGDSPKATDTVTTHYRGKLIDGTEFDSSYNRGEPAKFAVNGVIPGWTEALQLMKPGAKWELFIPSKLAYGEQGVGQIIGPNSTLIFEVELLSVDKAGTASEKKPEQTSKKDNKKVQRG